MFCTKCGREKEKSSVTKFCKGLAVATVVFVAIWVVVGALGCSVLETPASVRTDDATGVTADSATLNGNLTDFNDAVDADVSFQWGTNSKSYPYETEAKSMALETPGPFSFNLTGLTSNTTYYYRAKADCGGYGTTYGKEESFTTP